MVLLLIVAGWRIHEASRPVELPFETANRPPAPAPMCPWREPDADLKMFFPDATGYTAETRILSGLRVELAARLGRPPTGDENALRVYSIHHDETPLGAMLTRRVKGALGAIEVVVAVNTNQEICGVRLQRLRETETSAAALENADWLRSFTGKRADSSWLIGKDFPDVLAETRISAEAIADGVRSSLILLAAENESRRSPTSPHH